MREEPSLPRVYSKGLAWHGCGHALYHPVPTESMKAPCVGYFDAQGKWHLITRLTGQSEDLQWRKSEYTFLEKKPQPQAVATHRWGPKQSTDVYDIAVGLTAGTPDLSAAGIPAQFSIDTKFRTASNFGAFLVTTPPVAHENLNEGYNAQYKRWIQDNFDVLYQNGKEELERYGLWVITETYSTSACMIQTWSGKTKEITLDVKANAMMAGEFGPLFETSRDRQGSSVNFHSHGDYGGRVVVFCDGLRYSFKRWKGIKHKPHLSSRDAHTYGGGTTYSDTLETDSDGTVAVPVDMPVEAPIPVGEPFPAVDPVLDTALTANDGTEYDIRESNILDSDSDSDDGGSDEDRDKTSSPQFLPGSESSASHKTTALSDCNRCHETLGSRYYHCLDCPLVPMDGNHSSNGSSKGYDLCNKCVYLGCERGQSHQFLPVGPSTSATTTAPKEESKPTVLVLPSASPPPPPPVSQDAPATVVVMPSLSTSPPPPPLTAFRPPPAPQPRPSTGSPGRSKTKARPDTYAVDCDGCRRRDLQTWYRCRDCEGAGKAFDFCEECWNKGKKCKNSARHGFSKMSV